jgi:TonB family protein
MTHRLTTLAVITALALSATSVNPAEAMARLPQTDQSRRATPIGSPAEWVTYLDYPPAAMQAGQQGKVSILFRILPTGRVDRCETTSSSGSDLLDAMTCALVTARARYTPARDTRGQPTEGASRMLYSWRLPEEEAPKPPLEYGTPSRREIEVDVDANGKITDCRVTERTGQADGPEPDPCLPILESGGVKPLVRDGKPVASRMTLTTSMTFTPR